MLRNQFPAHVKTLNKDDILVEFPGDISWLQKENKRKNLPIFRIFTNEMGNNFVSLSDEEISINELPQTAFHDTRGIRRPERNELDKDIFPTPTKEDIKVTAQILLEQGHIEAALEILAEVDPSELDSDYIFNTLLKKKDDYPHGCAFGLSRWFRTAIDNKFVQLLKFYDLNNDKNKEIDGLKDAVKKMRMGLIQQNGPTYMHMAAQLSSFIRTFPEQQLPPLEEIIRHHISSLKLKLATDTDTIENCILECNKDNGETVRIIKMCNPISRPSVDGNVFLQTCLGTEESKPYPKIGTQLMELFTKTPKSMLMKNFYDHIHRESNQKIIQMFNIKGEALFPLLLGTLSIYNELCFAEAINFLISFEHTNILPVFKTWFISRLEDQTVLKSLQNISKGKSKTQRADMEKFFNMLGINYKDILKKQAHADQESEKL